MKYLTASLFSVVVLAVPVQAASILTDENLNKLQTLLPQLMALEAPEDGSFQDIKLQQHCDWKRHYNDFREQEKNDAYLQQAERLVTQQGFTLPQFLELSAKVSYPVLEATLPALEMSRQALAFLPEAQRQETEAAIAQSKNYHQVINSCLTTDDKAALQKYNSRIMQMFGGLAGYAG